jgi:hypothetical protein
MPGMKALLAVLGGLTAGTLAGLATARAVDSRRMGRTWRTLEKAEAGGAFAEDLVRDLPEPVRQYFRHAIRLGAPLYSRVTLRQSGRIKSGKGAPWMDFTARQILTPRRGFVWKARARLGPIFLDVTDHYAGGAGRTRVALLGLVPVVNASGPDLSRSALGRLIAESVLVPASLLPQPGVTWQAADDHHLKATLVAEGNVSSLDLIIGDEGGVQEVTLLRYGNQTESGQWAYIPFGMRVERENTFDGYTIPSHIRGGWWYGTERYTETIRLTIDDAEFR